MNRLSNKRKRHWLIPIVILVVIAAAFFIYTENYYHADQTVLSALRSDETVTLEQTDFGWLFDGPSTEDLLIFYPGGKVEETAYAPLLHLLAEKGIDVCLVKMPFRLAVFGINKADAILSQYDYDYYYIGGHSLGGVMAASYAAGHAQDLTGLILLAAYPIKPLDEDLIEITLYGSEDEVVNTEKIVEGRQYAPAVAEEYLIEGGNHAQFGNYGIQAGDGEARISAAEQQEQASDRILDIVLNQ